MNIKITNQKRNRDPKMRECAKKYYFCDAQIIFCMANCGKTININDNWELAHIKAHSKNGLNNIQNLVPTCFDCNNKCSNEYLLNYMKNKGCNVEINWKYNTIGLIVLPKNLYKKYYFYLYAEWDKDKLINILNKIDKKDLNFMMQLNGLKININNNTKIERLYSMMLEHNVESEWFRKNFINNDIDIYNNVNQKIKTEKMNKYIEQCKNLCNWIYNNKIKSLICSGATVVALNFFEKEMFYLGSQLFLNNDRRIQNDVDYTEKFIM